MNPAADPATAPQAPDLVDLARRTRAAQRVLGAAPAEAHQPTVVLGSRGTPSWILLGTGNPNALWSAAHGAGRKLGRSEAVAKLKPRYPRASLRRTRHNGSGDAAAAVCAAVGAPR